MINDDEAYIDSPEKEEAPIIEKKLDSWFYLFPSNPLKGPLSLSPTGAKYHQVKYDGKHMKMGVSPKINKW